MQLIAPYFQPGFTSTAFFSRLVTSLSAVFRLKRQGADLVEMDDRMLRDVGVTRHAAQLSQRVSVRYFYPN